MPLGNKWIPDTALTQIYIAIWLLFHDGLNFGYIVNRIVRSGIKSSERFRALYVYHDDVIKWKQRPVTWNFGVFFDLRMNERLSKHS